MLSHRRERAPHGPMTGKAEDRSTIAERPGTAAVPVAGLMAPPPLLSRRAASVDDPLGGTEVSSDIEDMLARSRGGGRPLPDDVAAPIGAAMDADLSGVRIHHDAASDTLSRRVQAVAFTQGSDIYFSAGSYSPATTSGQHLIAHELAHVVQGSGGSPGTLGRSVIGRADDPAEVSADRIADRTLTALRRMPAPRTAPMGEHEADGHRAEVPAGAISRVIRRGKKKNKAMDVDQVAKQVAEHAYDKHHDEWDEPPSKESFVQTVSDMMMGGATDEKALSGDRTAYYNSGSNILVIWNTARPDRSTCFMPTRGKSYYDGLT